MPKDGPPLDGNDAHGRQGWFTLKIGDIKMPVVNGKEYSYSPKGKRAAAKARKTVGGGGKAKGVRSIRRAARNKKRGM